MVVLVLGSVCRSASTALLIHLYKFMRIRDDISIIIFIMCMPICKSIFSTWRQWQSEVGTRIRTRTVDNIFGLISHRARVRTVDNIFWSLHMVNITAHDIWSRQSGITENSTNPPTHWPYHRATWSVNGDAFGKRRSVGRCGGGSVTAGMTDCGWVGWCRFRSIII